MSDNPAADADDGLTLFQIKCRFSGAVRFEGRFASMRLCVEAGVKARANLARANLDGANLGGAYLARANLDGANLGGAYLARANLDGANLDGANLDGAYLARANLGGAYLARANLAGANLDGANLDGANLGGAKVRQKNGNEATLTGMRPIFQVTPIGSRAATLTIMRTAAGLLAQTGCFGPAPLADFEAAVTTTHGDGKHGAAYRAAVALARLVLGEGGS